MSRLKLFALLSVIFLGAVGIFLVSIAHQPDFELHFNREVPSLLSPTVLGKDISASSNWLSWFFNLKDAKMIDFLGRPYPIKEQTLLQGAVIKLWIEPKEKQWKRFE